MISKSPTDTAKIAGQIAPKIKNGGLVCLIGDLGSGKTTFTKSLMENFGIANFSVKSPTYTYIRHYLKQKQNIYHVDLYRLETLDELLVQEIRELLNNQKNILIIEWADKLSQHLSGTHARKININFRYLDENSREIEITEQ